MVPGEMPESRRENTANLKLRDDLWGEAQAHFIQITKKNTRLCWHSLVTVTPI